MMDFQAFFQMAMNRTIPQIRSNEPGEIALNLGSGKKLILGSYPLDYPVWDADCDPIPFDDDSVGLIYAYHFLEHCKKPILVLQECQRVLKDGGIMNICVPYYTSQMAAHDLDHKHVFCEETWRNLFSTEYYDKYKIDWKFEVGFNLICGVVERNLCLLTQLIKRSN